MPTLTGAQVWAEQNFVALKGMRVGFVANHTAMIDYDRSTLLALVEAQGVSVSALFGPEHGAFGTFDDTVPDQVEPLTGLPILSLYGESRKPTAASLSDLDALVFEMQDIGARFYTYASTLGLCLEACAENGLKLIVLDRPNPITGTHCEGPIADIDRLSFTAYHPTPIRHGLTLGELAQLYASEKGYGDIVQVAKCRGYHRDLWFDQTGATWRHPSPAMRSLDAATLYPGVCLLEQTNFSVGRGTDAPFEMIGAPYIDPLPWIAALREITHPGCGFTPCQFTPNLRDFTGELCRGIHLTITDREVFNSVRLGIALIVTLKQTAPGFESNGVLNLLANEQAFDLIESGASVDEICASWANDLAAWEDRRESFLLY